jgi:two-component system alkaline phosphatase synthesis response regulator PhoP
MSKILIVDDEEDIRELLKYNLQKEGFEVSTAENGEVALEMMSTFKPDLILLDVMMPGMDGVEVCEAVRQSDRFKNTLICFLTARGEDYSQIAGLEAGADDYVSKPIKPRVLITRIKALLRRKGDGISPTEGENKGLIIDRDRYIIEKDGVVMHLPRKEFELLSLLASKPNFVFERDVILEKVWGTDIVVGDRTIDVHIRKLREKIGNDYIKTVKGIGYKFCVEEEDY